MQRLAPPPSRCADCGRVVATEDLVCTLCGRILRRESATPRASVSFGLPVLRDGPQPAAVTPRDGRWLVLGVGALLAPVLTLTPLLRYVGWFLSALVHEMGHVAAAWVVGCPAFPAIRLDGHAAAIHREQQPLLCVLALFGLAALAWSWRAQPRRLAVGAALLVAYPVVAFTGVREVVFLLAGHLGELAFATYAFAAALSGGFSGTAAERFAHAGVACYLVGRVGVLAVGLLLSESARDTYAAHGSFGLENDLIRLSRDCLQTHSLAPGALFLLAGTLAVVGFALWRAHRRPAAI